MYQDQTAKSPTHAGLRLFILVLLAVGGLALWQISKHQPAKLPLVARQPGLYRVIKIDDGDTIEVSGAGQNETVRLIGIDTPEVKDPRKPVQCFGQEASNQTKSLLTGQSVRLEPDPIGDNRDKYHRLLRYVYKSDGTFINETLVKEGYAFAYTIFPFEKLGQFKQDESQARSAGLGLWSRCQINESTEIKQTNAIQ